MKLRQQLDARGHPIVPDKLLHPTNQSKARGIHGRVHPIPHRPKGSAEPSPGLSVAMPSVPHPRNVRCPEGARETLIPLAALQAATHRPHQDPGHGSTKPWAKISAPPWGRPSRKTPHHLVTPHAWSNPNTGYRLPNTHHRSPLHDSNSPPAQRVGRAQPRAERSDALGSPSRNARCPEGAREPPEPPLRSSTAPPRGASASHPLHPSPASPPRRCC